jgi:hypothetical protein
MYSLLKNIHSYWAYLVLLILILGIFNAIAGKIKGKDFESKDLRLSLFGLIFSHIQLLIGLILYFVSPWFGQWSDLGYGGVMNNAQVRLYLVEHPLCQHTGHCSNYDGLVSSQTPKRPREKISTDCFVLRIGIIVAIEQNPLG